MAEGEPALAERIDDGATFLRSTCLKMAPLLLAAIDEMTSWAPFRHYLTRNGQRIGAAMTAAGSVGWVSDGGGYRYAPVDPKTGLPWPPIDPAIWAFVVALAAKAGHPCFRPDTLLVNRYAPGTGMGLHRDRDEADMTQPIVSLSLGLPATFLWAGCGRSGPTRRIPLAHGDAVVWGGPARLARHGVAPLRPGHHPATHAFRYNLTFRRARPLELDP